METTDAIELLKKRRDEYLTLAKSIDITIEVLEKNNNVVGKIINDGYSKDMSLIEKVKFFLNKENRFLHNRELADFVKDREPEIDTDQYVQKFSSLLSRLKKDGLLTNIQIGSSLRNTFWGNPKWLDQDAKIIKGHEINEKYLIDSEKNKRELF